VMQVGMLGYKCAVALFWVGVVVIVRDVIRFGCLGWSIGYTHLDSRSDDLVWVAYSQRKDFASSGSHYVRDVGLGRG